MGYFRSIVQGGAFLLFTGFFVPVHAESSAEAKIKALEARLEQSMALIEQLAAKVSQLEQAGAGVREVQTQSARQSAKIEQIEQHVASLGSGVARHSGDVGLPLHGFADVGLVKSGEDNPVFGKGPKGATVGTVSLYMAPQFTERVRSLVELAFEVDAGGDVETDLERVQIGYAFSDAAIAWLGRFHTPYGYWNTAFHHGAQIQPSLTRPRLIDFEDDGGILPAHTTGLWLTGAVAAESGRFGYDIYLGNAPQINGTAVGSALSAVTTGGFSPALNALGAAGYAGSGTLNMRQAGSDRHRTSTGFNAWLEPRFAKGLRIGLHGLRTTVVDDSADANETRLNMFGGYLTYLGEPWEIVGEYYRFRNRDLSGATGNHGSWAGFAQVGHTFGAWTPYARTERAQLDQDDNYFAVLESGRSYKRSAFGVRYDVDPKAALKVEINRTHQDDLGTAGSDSYVETRAQYSIRF
ncbi:MAG: PspA/IM30 family protein [Rhodocyclaceae bacterium]|jgi:hypothetical protein|nr:PspA/IM30 family protein [Rhodocyclaceae bacterium]